MKEWNNRDDASQVRLLGIESGGDESWNRGRKTSKWEGKDWPLLTSRGKSQIISNTSSHCLSCSNKKSCFLEKILTVYSVLFNPGLTILLREIAGNHLKSCHEVCWNTGSTLGGHVFVRRNYNPENTQLSKINKRKNFN